MEQVRATIRTHGLIAPGDHVLAAVSGGADSVAMLHALAELRDAFGFSLAVAHLDHGLRGEASAADAAFVRALAAERGLDCLVESADICARAAEGGLSIEMAARAERYAFFARAAARCGARSVATGHTLDDQAETVLLRLTRGAGMQGLGGIARQAHIRGLPVIRPLREVRRAEVLDFLRARGAAWREDASNLDPAFLRNRVRHEVLPLLRDRINPRVEEALARAADLLADDEAWLDALAQARLEALRLSGEAAVLDAAGLAAEPAAARRRVLRCWLAERGVDPAGLDLVAVERVVGLLATMEGSARVPLPGGGAVERRYTGLHHLPAEEGTVESFDAPIAIPGETHIAQAGLCVTAVLARGVAPATGGRPGDLPAEASIDLNRIGGAAVHVRNWRDGDRIVLAGGAGTRKLQDVFADAKIPRSQRLRVPLLVCREEIVWVPGYRVAGPWHIKGAGAPAARIRIERR